MPACPSPQKLREILRESLPSREAESLSRHVEECPQCQAFLDRLSAFRSTPAPSVPSLVTPPVTLPHYQNLRHVGEGGMGIVYQGFDDRLRRPVAVKFLREGPRASPEARARFQTEARAVARLQDPHVVGVYEVGEQDGWPFLVMEYLSGGNLARHLAGQPQSPARAASVIEILSRAVAHAHSRGIIHRDLKPGNILLSSEGVLKITDFGLARWVEEREGLTTSGALLGTPGYMAPEQASGNGKQVGQPADIWALGVILYESLTGRLPFHGPSDVDTLLQVLTEEPTPPSRLVGSLPRDLETICLKCLEKDPPRRYASAGALGDDLRRFREGRPIEARRVTKAEHLWRWTRRNPAMARLLLALLGTVSAGLTGTGMFAWRANLRSREVDQQTHAVGVQTEAARKAREEVARAERETRKVQGRERHLTYASRVQAASRSIARSSPHLARQELEAVQPARTGGDDLRDIEWHYLHRRLRDELVAFAAPASGATVLVYSPAGRSLLVAAGDGSLALHQPEDGRRLETWKPHTQAITGLSFSRDGKVLATGSRDGTACILDGTSGKIRHRFDRVAGSADGVAGVALSPDGRWLACATVRGARLFDVARLTEVTDVSLPDAQVTAVSFTPDGTGLLCAGTWERKQGIWLTRFAGQPQREDPLPFEKADATWTALAACSSGRVAACRRDASEVNVWNLGSRRRESPFGDHRAFVDALAAGPDGLVCITADRDGTIRAWDSVNGTEHQVWLTEAPPLRALAISPDARCVAASDEKGLIRIWDATRRDRWTDTVQIPPGQPPALVRSKEGGIPRAISPDGKILATTGRDRLIHLQDADSGERIGTLRGHEAEVSVLVWTPNGKRLLSGGNDSTVRIWDPLHETELLQIPIPPGIGRSIRVLEVHREGRLVVVRGSAGTLVLDALEPSADWHRARLKDQLSRAPGWHSVHEKAAARSAHSFAVEFHRRQRTLLVPEIGFGFGGGT